MFSKDFYIVSTLNFGLKIWHFKKTGVKDQVKAGFDFLL